MKAAKSQIGVKEYANGWNPKIKEYQNSTDVGYHFKNDSGGSNAWCACFVNWALEKVGLSGLSGYDGIRAKSWENYGQAAKGPSYGAIGVKRSWSARSKRWQYHVGFVAGVNQSNTHVLMLGGNQANSVKYSWYPSNSFTAFRLPSGMNTNIAIPIYNKSSSNVNESTR